MKVLSAVIAGLGLATSAVRAHPLDLPFEMTEEHHEFMRRATGAASSGGYFPITGVDATAAYPRLEIRTLVHEQPNQFALFILAMQKWQATAQSSSTSYYQISGIHGVPRQNWNNVPQCPNGCGNADGYCTHASVLFPAWHRCYLALFEQQLYKIVANIAASWPKNGVHGGPTQADMHKAAHSFRLPYWDWAAIPPPGTHTMPGALSGNGITIQTQTGLQTIANPLYKHKFQDPSNLYYPPYTSWQFTIRYPTNDSADAVAQEADAVAAFDQNQASLQDQVYQLMTTCTDYLHFSNIAGGSGSTSCSNSLENIHDLVHAYAGGPGTQAVPLGGDMALLSLAAFDPIFWLHHANVDRLFAFWQRLHPGSYGASQVQVQATWTYPNQSVQNANSPLKPFTKNSAGDFWTTNEVRNWQDTFHYTYPEFTNGKGSKEDIASVVNKLYGPNATPISDSSNAAQAENFAATTAAPAATATPTTIGGLPDPFTAVNGSAFQYVANIKTPRNAISGPYNIYLFNGKPTNNDPTQWLFDSNLIGTVAVLSGPNMAGAGTIITGSVPLTRTLMNAVTAGKLADLTEFNAAMYLQKNLVWRIGGPGGAIVDPSKLPGFELAVYASSASPLASIFELPKWSEFFPLPEVTKGKAGGLAGILGTLESAASSIIGEASSIL